MKDLNDEHSRLNINSSNQIDEAKQDILVSIGRLQQSLDEQGDSQALQRRMQPHFKHQRKQCRFRNKQNKARFH